jgi:hypothetical protein
MIFMIKKDYLENKKGAKPHSYLTVSINLKIGTSIHISTSITHPSLHSHILQYHLRSP